MSSDPAMVRADPAVIDALAALGVATVHEAQGRTGLMAPRLRPIFRPARIAGSAVTCRPALGDNLAIHQAVALCQPGDVLVAATEAGGSHGYFGDLLGLSLHLRGGRGLVIDGGVRDIAELTAIGLPAWASEICAQGADKTAPGPVNAPIVCGGVKVFPGDVIVADDDGVVVVRRTEAERVLLRAQEREAQEVGIRERLRGGETTLEIFGLPRA